MGVKKRWMPTEAQITEMGSLSGYGLRLVDIADFYGISDETLKRAAKKSDALRESLKRGKATANAAVGQTLYKMATSGKQPAATIFWMKCQLQWRDVTRLEGEVQIDHSGSIANPYEKTVFILPVKDDVAQD